VGDAVGLTGAVVVHSTADDSAPHKGRAIHRADRTDQTHPTERRAQPGRRRHHLS
jgi:hypothetical protein